MMYSVLRSILCSLSYIMGSVDDVNYKVYIRRNSSTFRDCMVQQRQKQNCLTNRKRLSGAQPPLIKSFIH